MSSWNLVIDIPRIVRHDLTVLNSHRTRKRAPDHKMEISEPKGKWKKDHLDIRPHGCRMYIRGFSLHYHTKGPSNIHTLHYLHSCTKQAVSRQIWGARSSRSVHLNPLVEIWLFSMVLNKFHKNRLSLTVCNSKSLELDGLHPKLGNYVSNQSIN